MIAGYEPRFDIDRPFGEQAEEYVADGLMRSILNGSVEVKRDARFIDTGRFYIETHQRERCHPQGQWLPSRSGILCTEADYWALVPGELATVVFVPVPELRAWATRPGVQTAECSVSDCPTMGALLPWASIGAHLRRPLG